MDKAIQPFSSSRSKCPHVSSSFLTNFSLSFQATHVFPDCFKLNPWYLSFNCFVRIRLMYVHERPVWSSISEIVTGRLTSISLKKSTIFSIPDRDSSSSWQEEISNHFQGQILVFELYWPWAIMEIMNNYYNAGTNLILANEAIIVHASD